MSMRLAMLVGVVVAAATVSPSAPLAAAGAQPGPDIPSRELLDRYCVTCHNERLQHGMGNGCHTKCYTDSMTRMDFVLPLMRDACHFADRA